MLRGGWRHHLITKAASAAARYVLHDGRPSCGYVGNDLHFSFAFKTEEAAHSWKCTARPRRPRPLGQSDAITMRLSSRPRADVEIGALVDPEDYDQMDTRSPDDAWGSFCSDARSVRWVHVLCLLATRCNRCICRPRYPLCSLRMRRTRYCNTSACRRALCWLNGRT